jgi:hypothetical protein
MCRSWHDLLEFGNLMYKSIFRVVNRRESDKNRSQTVRMSVRAKKNKVE